MLRELFVQNLALIEDARVELQPGFCAWTGETGAGKSLLLGALGLLLGERGSSELLRAGADTLRVTGRFEIGSPDLRADLERILDASLEEDEILLARRLGSNGRSQAYINDQPVAVATLKRVGAMLVDIHGQRETESLLQPTYQLQLLDAFGQLTKPQQQYRDAAEEMRGLRRTYQKLSQEREQRARELSLIRFEREELDQADPQPGELDELKQERRRLANAQQLQIFGSEAVARLSEEEGSIVEQIGRLRREAENQAELDDALGEVADRLAALGSEAQDLAQSISGLEHRWEADPRRLEEVELRIDLLEGLELKYRKPVDELIIYRLGLDEREGILQREEEDLAGIEGEMASAFDQLKRAAEALGKQRKKVAKRLATAVQKQLKDLGMPDAKLTAVLEPVPLGEDPVTAEIPAWGTEQMELILEANPGEPARPLRKVASGGELSRAMLALKTVLADHDSMSTLVFDEIDANVGGRLGDVLGQKLAALGKTHQVICVTHLPQVAGYASHHWTIRKQREGSRTKTTITPLTEEERLDELASMLRGEARGETTRKEAQAMLEAAKRNKP